MPALSIFQPTTPKESAMPVIPASLTYDPITAPARELLFRHAAYLTDEESHLLEKA